MKSILIWDHDHIMDNDNINVVYWRSYGVSNVNGVIIPDIVEEHSNEIRQLYLEWVYEIGNKKYQGQYIREILSIEDGISLWWMSLIIEKCNFSKSPLINDACKFIAFVKWASIFNFSEVKYCGKNKQLSECLKIWCKQKRIIFVNEFSIISNKEESLKKRLYNLLPFSFQAFFWLMYYVADRWKLRGIGVSNWKNSKAKLTFVSYFANLNTGDLSNNKYGSNYWNDLVEIVSSSGKTSNWLHIYMPNNVVPNSKKAKKILSLFNNEKCQLQNHVFLDSFLSLKLVFKVIKEWFSLRNKVSKLERAFFNLDDETLNLWPFFKKDWYCSFTGKTSISNIWNFFLFKEAMSCLPKQENCVYLQENIDWEFAFIFVCKAFGHGNLIAFPHSTIRFWDLRYFCDKRLFDFSSDFPRPNFIAINGKVSKLLLLESGYPPDMLIDVEALRYNYLHSRDSLIYRKEVIKKKSKVKKFNLLVVGDIELETNLLLIKILKGLSSEVFYKLSIKFKPHPLCPISPREFLDLPIEIVTTNLNKQFIDSDIVFAGSVTTAALEAYLFELPVITLLLSNSLNLSPLRNFDVGVFFIRNCSEFEKALLNSFSLKIEPREQSVFFIDPLLPRWKELLKL
jgi:surface carbohydrate biosynthesis protein (TIGR04326 family)